MSAETKANPKHPRRAPRMSRTPFCVYCGWKLKLDERGRWPGTCRAHSDLPALDPLYSPSLTGYAS